jgi:hypothetical protein
MPQFGRVIDPNDHLFANEKQKEFDFEDAINGIADLPMVEERKKQTKRKYIKRSKSKIFNLTHQNKTNQMSQFENVTMKAVAQAMHILTATKCAYKIVTVDGIVFQEGDVHAFHGHGRKLNHPRGFIAAHFKPHLEPMKIGDIAEIPWHPEIKEDDLQSAMTAWMTSKWGKGTYTTQKNNTKKVIEVLRYK